MNLKLLCLTVLKETKYCDLKLPNQAVKQPLKVISL